MGGKSLVPGQSVGGMIGLFLTQSSSVVLVRSCRRGSHMNLSVKNLNFSFVLMLLLVGI